MLRPRYACSSPVTHPPDGVCVSEPRLSEVDVSCNAALLEHARVDLGLSVRDLWFDYFALGGSAALGTLGAFLDGAEAPSDHDYDVVAVALNETYGDRGGDHPVPYSKE
jgi:hypothetical protein